MKHKSIVATGIRQWQPSLPQIVELNVVKSNTDDHIAQLLRYLKSSQIETGLLISFGTAKLYIRKYLMTQEGQPPKMQRDIC